MVQTTCIQKTNMKSSENKNTAVSNDPTNARKSAILDFCKQYGLNPADYKFSSDYKTLMKCNANFVFDGNTYVLRIPPVEILGKLSCSHIQNRNNIPSEVKYSSVVIIPNTVTEIGEAAFYNSSFYEIKLGDNVSVIKPKAFMNNDSLVEFNNNKKVKRIPEDCFRDCIMLKSVNLGEIEKIYSYAFKGCKQLTEAYYDCDEVNSTAFVGCNL